MKYIAHGRSIPKDSRTIPQINPGTSVCKVAHREAAR